MTADEFYEEFKSALRRLEVTWGEKDSVEIFARNGNFVLEKQGKKASFGFPVRVSTPKKAQNKQETYFPCVCDNLKRTKLDDIIPGKHLAKKIASNL